MSPDNTEIVAGGDGRSAPPSSGEERHERVERSTESRPVLEVEGAPHPLTEADAETTPRAVADPLVPPLQVVDAAGHERRQRRPDEKVSGVGVAVVDDPRPLVVVDDRAFPRLEHAPVAGVDHDERDVAEPAGERESVATRHRCELLGRLRPLAQVLESVVELAELAEHALGADLSGAQVPQMLVDPVRDQTADDVLAPPRLLTDLADPRVRDVPVVDHVVVVEDHRRRHHREEPALDVGRPRLVVQPAVLLEVADELGRQALDGFVARVGSSIRSCVTGDESSA